MTKIFYLAHQNARDNCSKFAQLAPEGCVVVFSKPTRSGIQNDKVHAMIGEVAKQAAHLGAKWDAESWKRLLVDEFCKDNGLKRGAIIPNLSGDGIVQLGMQTRKFTKEQASEFVEWLHAWGALNGIVYSEI